MSKKLKMDLRWADQTGKKIFDLQLKQRGVGTRPNFHLVKREKQIRWYNNSYPHPLILNWSSSDFQEVIFQSSTLIGAFSTPPICRIFTTKCYKLSDAGDLSLPQNTERAPCFCQKTFELGLLAQAYKDL